MSGDIAKITKVRPAGGRVLHVRFAGDRRDRRLDMTGLIARSAHFAPLMDDADSFAKVVIVEDGLGLDLMSPPQRCGGSLMNRNR